MIKNHVWTWKLNKLQIYWQIGLTAFQKLFKIHNVSTAESSECEVKKDTKTTILTSIKLLMKTEA